MNVNANLHVRNCQIFFFDLHVLKVDQTQNVPYSCIKERNSKIIKTEKK